MSTNRKTHSLLHPKLIPAWIAVFVLYCISFLSIKRKLALGAWLGDFAYNKLKSRARITKRNISACFPELSDSEHDRLTQASFEATAQGFLESTHSWWRNMDPIIADLKITGQEHLLAAQSKGKGILLIGGHFNVLDLALPLIASQLKQPGYCYRPNNNPVVDRMIENGRRRHYGIKAYDKRSIKEMIEFMKQGGEVWYAADQDLGKKSDLFVPFFGNIAACVSAPSWIARESGATVLFVSQYRLPEGGYEIVFEPLSEDFGEHPEADAIEWNEALANGIRRHPEQYLWQHKRFKTLPKGSPKFY